MTSDLTLLRDYAQNKIQASFAALVKRHLDLVHSAALRQVRSPQLAEEVAQSVFTDLARNAAKLKPDTILTAWLYQVTRRTAIDVVRREARRQLREQIATEMNAMNATADDWTHIEPLLDDAMEALDETDRTAVLLRYFENKSLRDVGQQLGVSEDAAQKRVSRAVDRLREFFGKREARIGVSGLVALISANAVQAAPVGLAATIAAAGAVVGTTVAVTAAATATKAIAMTTLQKIVITATLAVVAGAGIYETRQVSKLSDQLQAFQQQQAPLTVQVKQLNEALNDATNQVAGLQDENQRLNRNTSELLRLRGEVTRLRASRAELDSLQNENSRLRQLVEADSSKTVTTNRTPVVAKVLVTRIQQPQTVSDDEIHRHISSQAGSVFDRTLIDLDVRNLHATGLFANVRVLDEPTDDGIVLNYLVQEKPTLTAIEFSDTSEFSQEELSKLVSSKVGEPMDRQRISEDRQNLQALYETMGFSTTKVRTVANINESLGEAAILFEIVKQNKDPLRH